MISRILGFVRDILIASVLGAGPISDAFFVAFRIPNMFRRLVAEGAFSAAFIPLFSRHLEEEGKESALNFASHALGFLTGFLFLFSITFMIFMPALMQFLAPGFEVEGQRYAPRRYLYADNIPLPYRHGRRRSAWRCIERLLQICRHVCGAHSAQCDFD